MDELTVKNRIMQAVNEPPAPEELVEATVRRGSIISAGREAEKRLESSRGDLSRDELAQLAATGLVGRLAIVAPLPGGVRPDDLVNKLSQEPRFRKALEGGDVLHRLRSGELLLEVTAATNSRSGRENRGPERSAPERGGMNR